MQGYFVIFFVGVYGDISYTVFHNDRSFQLYTALLLKGNNPRLTVVTHHLVA